VVTANGGRGEARASQRAWFRTGARRLTEELATLFEQSPATRNLQIASAVPEHKTKFRDGAFGPRNHDLLLFGVAGGARTVIGIEVKADEALDKPIGARIKAAFNAREAGKRTVFPERVDNSSTG
jgi:hypothetical protein